MGMLNLPGFLSCGKKKVGAGMNFEQVTQFVKDFLKGRIKKELFKLATAALYFTYSALEEEMDRNKDNPVFGPLYFPLELHQREALIKDLKYFYGEDWEDKIQCSEATQHYVDRIHHVEQHKPELLVAHAYTRYMGDLSGGQVLKKVAQRALKLPSTEEGIQFYVFDNKSLDTRHFLSNEKDAHASPNDENSERGNWSSKGDYLLSMVGYAVGLGNVWRFPYLTYQNGGGAFLIPYTLMLALAGLPLFFMECSLGQFASLGPISTWRILPLFQGVGITMVIISTFVAIYYNVIIAYALYYLFASFQKVLPWSDCFSWADELCSKVQLVSDCNATLNGQIIHANYSFIVDNNLTCINGTMNYKPGQFPTEQYWNKVALQRSSGLDETGGIVWYLALCLLLAWTIVGAALFKGIKSSGKVVYFTALFPYVILLILLVRGATLEGALDGIEYYIGRQSNITKLLEAEVWKDAATQIFYSLSVAWGGLVALSSYNKFHNNCYSDAILVCVTNCLTSVFAGFAIFSILGHMALVSERPVSEVVDSGFDLAFVAYPEALSRLPVSPLWSVLFFFMLLLLGLDSQFATVETLTTTIQDIYPEVMKRLRIPITLGVCILLFLLGLVCVTQAGIYWVNLIDHFCAGWGILFAAVLEMIGIVYIYGGNRFIEDIEMMIGKKNCLFWMWWRMCWFFVTPVLLTAILVWSLVTFSPPTYGSVSYPDWGTAVGWCMIIFSVIWIPIVAIVKIVKAKGNLCQRIASCCRPAANWGPYLACNRGERYSHIIDPKNDLEIPTVSASVYSQQ